MDGPLLRIPIRSSGRLRAGLAFAGSLAVGAPWVSALGTQLCVLLDILALAYGCMAWPRMPESGAIELCRDAAGWWLRGADAPEPVEVMPGSTVWPLVIVLRLRARHRTHALVLLPDSAPSDDLRRLRVALRLSVTSSGHEDRVHGPL